MKYTSAIVIAALLAMGQNDVNAIKMPTKFIDSSDIQIKDEPAGDAIQKRLDSAKSEANAAEKKKNADR